MAFVERRMGASMMRHALLPMFLTDGLMMKAPPYIISSVTLHLQKDEISGRARLGWVWEAHWGSKSVIIWR